MVALSNALVGIACLPSDSMDERTRPSYLRSPEGVEQCFGTFGVVIVDRNQLGGKRRLRYQVIDAKQNVLLLEGNINRAWRFVCQYSPISEGQHQ